MCDLVRSPVHGPRKRHQIKPKSIAAQQKVEKQRCRKELVKVCQSDRKWTICEKEIDTTHCMFHGATPDFSDSYLMAKYWCCKYKSWIDWYNGDDC